MNPFKKNPNPSDTSPPDTRPQDTPAQDFPTQLGRATTPVAVITTVPAKDTDTEDTEGQVTDTTTSDTVDAVVRKAPSVSRRAAAREPILPLWARDGDTLREMILWGARYGQHVTAFHTVRVPVYAGRLAVRSPLGLARATRATYRWVTFKESAPLRHAIATDADRTKNATASDAATYIRLEDQRQDVVRHRTWVLCGGGAGVSLTSAVAAASMSAGHLSLTGAAATLALGWLGQPSDTPLLDRATSCEAAPRLTSDLIMIALSALGIAELNKGIKLGGDRGVHFIAPVARDGRGWRADIDLPPGVPVGAVIDRRSELAAGLRRPLSCVWPEADPDAHEGRLTLWVADQPMSALAPKPWPLLDKGAVNLFEPFPLGTDPKGKQVDLCLMFANMIIGAMPRFGKTFTLRLMLLAAALDPRVELHVFDLKGGADFLPLEPVAHSFRIGDDDADGDIEYLLNALRKLVADMRRRYKIIRSLPRDICPEGKVTDELASTKKLGLHPVLLALDECQRAFEHAEHGKEIASLVEDLVKRGPAVGIIAIPATQRPDVKSLPAGISSNAVLRFCLKVAGQTENDMVLGTSSYKNGTRATMFTRKDRGVGYLAGEGDDPQIVRTYYIDGATAETITARARAARIKAGYLTGHALGITPARTEEAESILDHLSIIWPTGQAKEWSETLAERLADHYPDTYPDLQAEALGQLAKNHGIDTRQIKKTIDGKPVNRRGLAEKDIRTAITDRDKRRAATGTPTPTDTPAQTPDNQPNSRGSSSPPAPQQ